MELCSTCKRVKCNRKIILIKEDNLTTIKCLEYEKDEERIRGYIESLESVENEVTS